MESATQYLAQFEKIKDVDPEQCNICSTQCCLSLASGVPKYYLISY